MFRSNLRLVTVLLLAVGVFAAGAAIAQDLHPSRRPSPMGMARTTVGDTYLRVVYSRPYERGRNNIFGTSESEALVPYGEVWRTGANEATEITVTSNVQVAGQTLPAGTYSLFTVPGPEEWTIHFNGELGLSGAGRFDPETGFTAVDLDATKVLEVKVPSKTHPTPETDDEEDPNHVEQLTISWEKTDDGADMVLRWIRTEVRVPFTVG